MEAKKVLDEIFKYHDELSHAAVFMDDDESRQISFTKAEALREVIEQIKDSMPTNEKERFAEMIEGHYSSFSKGIFYKRRLDLDAES